MGVNFLAGCGQEQERNSNYEQVTNQANINTNENNRKDINQTYDQEKSNKNKEPLELNSADKNDPTNQLIFDSSGKKIVFDLDIFSNTYEYSATYALIDKTNNRYIASIVINIPLSAKAGDTFSSEDQVDYAYGNGGVTYNDGITFKSYSAKNVKAMTGDQDYFGMGEMMRNNAYKISIDDISSDGKIISGRFIAQYAKSDYGTNDGMSIPESTFSFNLDKLPAPKDYSKNNSNSNSFNQVPDFDLNNGASTNQNNSGGICQWCNGTGIKSECNLCGGTGDAGENLNTLYQGAYVCPSCLGKGYQPCIHCNNGVPY